MTYFKISRLFLVMAFFLCSCDDDNSEPTASDEVVVSVDSSLFLTDNATVTIVPCTLSDGSSTDCYQVVTTSTASDHTMGPWCPRNITDDADAGGIWLENGQVYDVDGEFVENLATLYNDNTWLMYDGNGDIYVTDTEDDCTNAANPNVGAEYENFCVECLPSYITNVSQTWMIPVTPVKVDNAVDFATGPGGAAVPSTRGIAFNGVEFSAPAPVSNILGAYTLAPFDDAGGHINVNQGYHYHAATGLSTSITQADGHAAMIGYALDGYGIYEYLDASGNEASDLDDCRGHYDETRGYHYHVDFAGNNNFINCLAGAYVN